MPSPHDLSAEQDTTLAAHYRGVWYLLSVPTVEAIDRAVYELEVAAAGSTLASITSDLGAAYFLQGIVANRPSKLIAALDATERALEKDSTLPEAAFNRALILERLHLWGAASDAWRQFEALGPSSAWARESTQRRTLLAPRLEATDSDARVISLERAADESEEALASRVREDPHTARTHVERNLFASWARSVAAGDEKVARRSLDSAGRIATALAAVTGDELALQAWRAIASAQDDPTELSLLAVGHLGFASGMEDYDRFDFVPARKKLRTAAEALEQAGSSFAAWGYFYAAVCLYYIPDYPGVLTELEAIGKRGYTLDFPNLAGRVSWIEGLVLLVMGDLAKSQASYEKAQNTFESTSELGYVAYLHSLIAKNLRYSGAGRQTWHHHLQALAGRNLLDDMGRRFAIFLNAAEQAEADGNLRAALYLMNGQVNAAEALGMPYVTAQAFLRRSRLHSRIGMQDRARKDEQRAAGMLDTIPDEGNRSQTRVDLLVTQGHTRLDTEPTEAVRILAEAQEEYRARSDWIDLLPIYPLIARAHLNTGRPDAAVDQLEDAIADIENARIEFEDPIRRAVFLEGARTVFDLMIEIQAEVFQDDPQALAYADRSRNRVLLDHLRGEVRTGASARQEPRWDHLLGEISEPLVCGPPDSGMACLVYRATEGRVLGWLVHGGKIRRLDIQASPQEIQRLAESFHELLTKGANQEQEQVRLAATLLGKELLPFGSEEVTGGTILVVVRDRMLAGVPFSALVHPQTGSYLIEDWPVTTSPSLAATMAWAADGSEPGRSPLQGRRDALLAVADPELDRRAFPQLRQLPSAREESRAIAQYYAHSTLLEGEEATMRAFLEALPLHSVVHFGGHAIADAVALDRRGLVFARTTGTEPSFLRADEIRLRDLKHLELAVLSACSTSAGYYADSEELSSLAAAFLAAGTATVVSALWTLDDEIANKLATTFHRSFAQTRDAVSALRQAQLAMLAEPDGKWANPAVWSVFEAMGRGRLAERWPADIEDDAR